MSLSVHIEDALERTIAGTATAEEEAEVQAHVAECSACALHLRLAKAQRLAVRAPEPWEAQRNARVVAMALEEFQRSRVKSWRGFRLRLRLLVPLAAGVLVLMGVASAAWLVHERSAPPTTPAPHSVSRRHASAVPPAPSLQAVDNEVLPPVQSTPVEDQALPPTVDPPATKESPERRLHPSVPSAGALFEQAWALRGQNKRVASIAVFTKLQRTYPASRESRVSFAIVGRMLLDEKRPAEALAQFDQHLALNGEVDQEALAGRAAAFSQMGRAADEARAWQRLLAAHPDSVYAARARQRLSTLSASKATAPR